MRTRSNFGIIGQIQATTNSSTGVVLSSSDSLGVKGITVSGAGIVICDIALIGGGGGGSGGSGGAGGGAEVYTQQSTLLSKGVTYTVTIGSGGAGSTGYGNAGSSTTFAGTGISLRALYGGATGFTANRAGFNSGSGRKVSNTEYYNGSAVGGYISTYGSATNVYPGGAGAGGPNPSATLAQLTTGGPGVLIDWLGSNYYWAAGGGGHDTQTTPVGGPGGIGGGGGGNTSGAGGTSAYNNGGAGTASSSGTGGNGGANTGSGGGAGGTGGGGSGGSGSVIIRYNTQSGTSPVVTGSPTLFTVGSYTVYLFTATGTISFPTTTPITNAASKVIVADAAYNAQGWISGSTDYVGTTQNWAFTYAGLQNNSGGARTVTLPYDGNKYYMEIVLSTYNYPVLLFALVVDANSGGYNANPSAYVYDGTARGGYSVNVAAAGFVAGDTLNIAYNSATNKVFYGKNGVWSIDPVSGTGATITGASTGSSVRLTIMCGSTPGTTGAGTIRKSSQLSYAIPAGYYSASL